MPNVTKVAKGEKRQRKISIQSFIYKNLFVRGYSQAYWIGFIIIPILPVLHL